MTTGFQASDSNGNVRFQVTDYLARSLGIIAVSSASTGGSASDPNLALGTPWAIFFPSGRGSNSVRCIVTVSSNTVSWTFGGNYANTGQNPDGFIVYGVK